MSIFHLNPSDKGAVLNVTRYGNFTANFNPVPPPISNEYLIPLYGIIASTIIGWSIPSLIGWIRSKKSIWQLNHYHKEINLLYDDGKLDEEDIKPLDCLKTSISDAYARGNVNTEHFSSLKNEISVLYREILNKRMGSLDNISSNEEKAKFMNKIKEDISDMYAGGKLNESHYKLLKEKISEFTNEQTDNPNQK